MTLYQCLKCNGPLERTTQLLTCSGCGASWKIDDGILCIEKTDYWGEIPQEELVRLTESSKKEGWFEAVKTYFGTTNSEMFSYVADLNRAAWKVLLPAGPESVVLDIGAGLGAITHSLALNFEKVVSVEAVPERIRFLRERVRQEGLSNVELVQTTVQNLPFREESFDLIVLNGILEWIGEWDRRMLPREAQIDFLKRLHAMLKPGGMLMIGIENRIGFSFFLGRVDHSGFAFTNLMPRKVASWYLKLRTPYVYRMKLNQEKSYRTYTYSAAGYKKLLAESNFTHQDYFYPVDGYNLPHNIIPLCNRDEMRSYMDLQILNADRRFGRTLIRRLKRWMVHSGLFKYLVPDFIILAQKPSHSSVVGSGSIIEKIGDLVKISQQENGTDRLSYSLYSHPFKNKQILKAASEDREELAVAKIVNTTQQGYEKNESGYKNLEMIQTMFHSHEEIVSAVPKPLGAFRVGTTSVAVESRVEGVPLSRIVWDKDFFADMPRVKGILELIADWLVAFHKGTKEKLGQGSFYALPEDFLAPPYPVDGAPVQASGREETSAYRHFLQHGDFFVDNIFVALSRKKLSIIDWDNMGVGYPPLFDFFCLLSEFFYEDPEQQEKATSIEMSSFVSTFFAQNRFSVLIGEICRNLAESMGLDPKEVPRYFFEYLCVRYHLFASESEEPGKAIQQGIYRDYIDYFCSHRDQWLF